MTLIIKKFDKNKKLKEELAVTTRKVVIKNYEGGGQKQTTYCTMISKKDGKVLKKVLCSDGTSTEEEEVKI